ncbi:putative PKS/NRPS-like protein biosynthetic cluster [Aspergillus pseudoviridinutans]|uniref:PKS/NRPS-like protein biosynthetic cluster n=1 Tax=Aspergillus pseudoviridinutans TaxID=1517512 RepID=A0A9P3BG54_9EURO|nr:putative PKS/NRPS-like protein biosynthetic cluster [Aspergillus pseudoviridinutans]GIJ90552.1 putative PKS/NRPS-like protein biosynthetic cluster [Aspergillus pseudoviridinutans]
MGVTSDQPVRLYPTGHLAQWRDNSGLLEYIGRADDLVKISGYRVELGDIACCIEKHRQVHSCVVKYVQEGDVDYLEAYVIPADWDSHFPSDELVYWVQQRLPSYMVPHMVYEKRSFPLSANGKVDRRALQPDNEEQPCDEENGSHSQSDATQEPKEVNSPEMEDLVDWLASVLQEYLTKSEITPTDNFLSHGLSSLHAARLIGQIRQDREKSITLAQLHQTPTVEGLSKFLSSSDDKTTELPSLERCVQGSKHLDTDLLPPDCAGAHIQQTLEKYDLWDGRLETTQKIIVLEDDLSDSTLGQGQEQFKWLTDWASVIVHVGARVNWCEPYEAYYVPNVVGTRNIIRAAMLGRRKALHYVSSIDVWTVTGFINKIERVYENEPLMPHANAVPYDTGYSASQFVAEGIVQRARASGLPTAIYRSGFIIGHSQKSITNANDFFSRLIIGSIQSGYFPHLPTQRLEYVTVENVTAAILHIASSRENLGRAYHIVPPDRSVSVDYDQKYKMLREIGYPVQMIDYKEWVDKIRDSPENALESMMPLLDEPVYEDLSRLETSRNTPVYDPTNTARALQDRPDIKYVALDANLLQKFIHNWVKRGQYQLDHHCNGCLEDKHK